MLPNTFLMCLYQFYLLPVVPKSSTASLPLSELHGLLVLYVSHSGGWVMVSHCGYFLSLIIHDAELLFICLLVIWVPSQVFHAFFYWAFSVFLSVLHN